MTNCCYLEELLVAPSTRKQGIARRLLQAIRANAELLPLQPHLLGETSCGNRAAQQLYRHFAKQPDMAVVPS